LWFLFDNKPEVWVGERERPGNWGWTVVFNGYIWRDEELVLLGGYDVRFRLRGDTDREPPQQKHPMETHTKKKSSDKTEQRVPPKTTVAPPVHPAPTSLPSSVVIPRTTERPSTAPKTVEKPTPASSADTATVPTAHSPRLVTTKKTPLQKGGEDLRRNR
jgi:hypothetical protein